MVARQDGKPFPYPTSVEGVGPWAAGDDKGETAEQADSGERAPLQDRSEKREVRGMRVMATEPGMRQQLLPETLEREVDVPKVWEKTLDRQGNFIEDPLGGNNGATIKTERSYCWQQYENVSLKLAKVMRALWTCRAFVPLHVLV